MRPLSSLFHLNARYTANSLPFDGKLVELLFLLSPESLEPYVDSE